MIPDIMEKTRRRVSARFLSGSGIELGALVSPLWVGRGVQVRYVDRLTVDGLRRQYPTLPAQELTGVDVVDDGECLQSFGEGSLDFIIANHFLEHCENPLGAMRNHLARVRLGGYLYYAVPDKRFTFDLARPLTDFDHLVRDDREGPEWSRPGHFLEYARLVDGAPDAEAHARHLRDVGYSIHFHVWDLPRFQEILGKAWEYLGRTFSVEWFQENHGEIIVVLKRTRPRSRMMRAPHQVAITLLAGRLRRLAGRLLRSQLGGRGRR